MSEWNRRPCHETVLRYGSTIFLPTRWPIGTGRLKTENNIQDQILNHAALLHDSFNGGVPTVPMASMALSWTYHGTICPLRQQHQEQWEAGRDIAMPEALDQSWFRIFALIADDRNGSDLAWPCMEHDLINRFSYVFVRSVKFHHVPRKMHIIWNNLKHVWNSNQVIPKLTPTQRWIQSTASTWDHMEFIWGMVINLWMSYDIV